MSMVIEAATPVVVDTLLKSLISLVSELQFFGSNQDKIIEDLNYVRCFLQDAEDKKETNSAVRRWLEDLEDWIYNAENVLEVLSFPALRRQVELEGASTSKIIFWNIKNLFLSSVKPWWTRSSKLTEIKKRLGDFMEQISKLNLIQQPVRSCSRLGFSRPESVSWPSEPCIFGRDNDKSEIIRILLRQEEDDQRIGVIPIVGMGGLGKTTLARYVYNDPQVVSSFEARGWVCVSENYDTKRITKDILDSVSVSFHSTDMMNKSLDWIQGRLLDELRNKKFLLVLDDNWNDSYPDWDALRRPFMEGSVGSRIIVTTRSHVVADKLRTVPSFIPSRLSDDECWSLLCLHAGLDSNEISLFEEIGKKIAEKCSGLPLAAMTVGGSLRNKTRVEEWEFVLNSKCWMAKDIMAVLKMSYNDLDPQLKRCFVFLSILPEDYKFREMEVVAIWVGAGLIQLQDEDERSEIEVAGGCFHALLSRSLISPSILGVKQEFLMHDLIRDLAKEVGAGIRYIEKCGKMPESLKSTRHLSFHGSNVEDIFKCIVKQREAALCLRTFWRIDGYLPSSNSVDKMISRLVHVRALSLWLHRRYSFEPIGQLILLRYLDLSFSIMDILPAAITSLYNLRVLILRGSHNLKRLPKHIGKLIHLCHLDISQCGSLKELPEGIKELRKLQHLPSFIVGKKLPLSTLGGLNLLQERLEISGLQYTTSVDEARLARLSQERLQYLSLDWGESDGDNGREEEILDQLRPHEDLKKLSIFNYGGSRLSHWLTGACLVTNLTALQLSYLENCSLVLTFDALPSLEQVEIFGCPGIEVFLGAIPKLKRLDIKGCKQVNCIEAFRMDALDVLMLRDIDIDRMSSLLKHKIGMECGEAKEMFLMEQAVKCDNPYRLFSNISFIANDCIENMKVERLRVENQCRLPPWVSNAESLKMLEVYDCPSLKILFNNGTFPSSLTEIHVRDCPSLKILFNDGTFPSSLTKIHIRDCPSLKMLFNDGTFPPSLTEIDIRNCPEVSLMLPQGPFLSVLHDLSIWSCPLLFKKLPDVLGRLQSLSSLLIVRCDDLEAFLRLRLPNLKTLLLFYTKMKTFPTPDTQILHSIGDLYLSAFKELKQLSPFLLSESLSKLKITECSKLEYFPEDGLPPSIKELYIRDCPLLEKKLHARDKKLCSKIKHIPYISVNAVEFSL